MGIQVPAFAPTASAIKRPAPIGAGDQAAPDLRDLALDRIQQGLCVFDGQQRLRLFNRRYAEMYGLDPGQLWLGMTLRDVVDLRYAAGTGPNMTPLEYASWRDRIGTAIEITDTEVVLRNGCVHAIHHEPTADGGWVATFTDISERRRTERRVRHMAHHDMLTGLPNRAVFFERLQQSVARMRGDHSLQDHRSTPTNTDVLVAVMFLDLDRFKDVNDTLGHAAGDELLQQVARRIEQCLRQPDVLARLGGDEFALLLDEAVLSEAQAVAVAERVIETVSQPYLLDGREAVIGTTIGIAIFGRDAEIAPETLLRQADSALYRAKGKRRGSHCVFRPGMDAARTTRNDMERDLRRALAEDALELHFQPLLTLEPRRIVGAEALARWTHPLRGPVPPAEFISLAESAGLISVLGAWSLRTGCMHAASWDRITIAVNLSPEQVRQPNLTDMVEQTLAETGLPPESLELEITEGILLRDTEATLTALSRLRRLGVGIVLDDFGTGYSSLSYLRRFPFTKLKVDRSFVADILTDAGTAAIVQAIISLGRNLGIRVTIEGIETTAQLDRVQAMGGNEAQGYLLGRPCAPAAFAQLLKPAALPRKYNSLIPRFHGPTPISKSPSPAGERG